MIEHLYRNICGKMCVFFCIAKISALFLVCIFFHKILRNHLQCEKKTQFYAKITCTNKAKNNHPANVSTILSPLFLVEIFAFTFMNCPCDFCTGEICRYPYISKLASVQLFVYYLVYLDSIKPASINCLLQLISCGF